MLSLFILINSTVSIKLQQINVYVQKLNLKDFKINILKLYTCKLRNRMGSRLIQELKSLYLNNIEKKICGSKVLATEDFYILTLERPHQPFITQKF